MFGISVYFQDLDYEYLEKCAVLGAKYVFSSLHIPEEDYSDLDSKLPVFLKTCDQLGMEIVPDVSPVTFEKLKVAPNDFKRLKDLGFKALRLDYGFDCDKVIELVKDFKIMLNASVVDEKFIQEGIAKNLDFSKIALTHNFYPRNNTGLSMESFQKKNEVFRKYGLTIQAFVCGDDLKRFPLYEGLPTVEKHREIHPYVAAVELIHECGVEDVLIGDSKAKLETIEYIKDYMENKVMTIKVNLEAGYEQYYNQELHCRVDGSENVVRITTPRTKGIRPFHNGKRINGSITMDNELIGRYCGEMQLIKKDFPMDARVNVIGFIHPEFVELLNYIDADTTIKFVRI